MATSNFPSSLDTTSALPASISDTANLNSPNHADMHEVTNDAIIEIEEKLGTGDTTASAGAVLIGTGSGASAWDTTPTFVGAVTVGVNDTGHDVKFFGATDGSYMLWDESANSLHVSQQVTSSTLTDFTQALDKASIKLIGDYTEDHYQGAILWSTDDDNATKPKAGIWVKTTSSGSQLEFGTSGTYGTGITNTALSIGTDGTVTVAGELDAASLDISGNADIDGTLEADAITVNGTALNEYIADTVGAMVGSNTESGIVVSYEDGDNTLDFAVGTLNQDTTGTAALASTITVAALNTADQTVYPLFVDGATGTQTANTDSGLTYNPSSGNLTIGGVFTSTGLDINGNIDVSGTTDLDAVDVDGVLTVTDGSAGAPAIAFGSDTDSGLYLYSTGNISVATAGSRRANFSNAGFYSIKSTISTGFTYATWNSSTGYLSSTTSSERYKENIQNMPKSEWEKVYQLQARSFDWKDDGTVELSHLGKSDFGLIAEEVNDVIPTLTGWAKEDYDDSSSELRIQSVQYDKITPYLVEAVKDLKARIETLEG